MISPSSAVRREAVSPVPGGFRRTAVLGQSKAPDLLLPNSIARLPIPKSVPRMPLCRLTEVRQTISILAEPTDANKSSELVA